MFFPSAEEFSGSLLQYVSAVEAAHPGGGMFRVVAPAGWAPSSVTPESLDAMLIRHPIRQHVRARAAAYARRRLRCGSGCNWL